jgi:membrane-associated HD superfamily phosphohydrolase
MKKSNPIIFFTAGILTVVIYILITIQIDLKNENQKLININKKSLLKIKDLERHIITSEKAKLIELAKARSKEVIKLDNQVTDKKQSTQPSLFDDLKALAKESSDPNIKHKESAVLKSSINVGEGNQKQIQKAYSGPINDFNKNLKSSSH